MSSAWASKETVQKRRSGTNALQKAETSMVREYKEVQWFTLVDTFFLVDCLCRLCASISASQPARVICVRVQRIVPTFKHSHLPTMLISHSDILIFERSVQLSSALR